ncbi:uncharacterized protein LOC134816802 [Bolinopsis microptera]|uniref:uncharacterized protein LOC134816802 n=1 Tax=Bolinopsis microptera TaxID=2820187 RepID=UPI003079CEC9
MCKVIERECAADNSTCVVVTELGQSPEGCVVVGGEAVSCCRLTLTSSSRDNVTSAAEVVELAAPNETRYLFNVTVLDLNKAKLLRSDRVSLTLVDNSELLLEDEYFELAIKRDSIPDELITPGLYIRHQGKVFKFWGDQINRVDERDLNKLGWYRNSPETDWRKILIDKVQIRTFNCGRNNGKAKIIGRYFNVEGSEGLDLDKHLVPLEDYHATRVETVVLESDKVVVRALGSHQGPVSVSLRSKRNTLVLNQVWLSDPAKLHSFTASITRDQYGNNILDLTLEGAAGEIEGYIETSGGVKERLAVITPDESYQTRVGVLTVCGSGIRVCLNFICRVPSCRSHQMRGFSAPNSRLIRRDMSKINMTYAGVWYSYGDPRLWFKSEFQFGESITAIMYLIFVVVLFRLIVKTFATPTEETKSYSGQDHKTSQVATGEEDDITFKRKVRRNSLPRNELLEGRMTRRMGICLGPRMNRRRSSC